MKTKFFLVFLIVIDLFLRIHNLSPFKIYPDSYQNLLVAQNITTYQSVLGYLGQDGMLYPDFFTWTRPGYALLINLVTFFTHSMTLAAQSISFFTGVAAIPLSYLFIKKVWGSINYALAGSALLAFSFNHTIWGGFIMTETIGIFFLLLFLMYLFKNLKTKPTFPSDFITGFLFSCAVITRYEYAILLLPVIFLLFRQSPQPMVRFITIVSTLFLTLAFIGVMLFPLDSLFAVIGSQLTDVLLIVVILIIFFLGTYFIKKGLKKYQNYFRIFYRILPILILLSILLCFIFINSIQAFVIHDLLLSIFALVGIIFMLQKKELRDYTFFIIFAILSLELFYYHVNPEMERYLTHLIPFLLIPASYGLITLYKPALPFRNLWRRRVLLMLLVVLQIIISYQGLRPSQDPEWFRVSYEEKAANILKNHLPSDPNILFIVSLPEPYFYNLQSSTYSIMDTYPFIFIDDSLDQHTVLLVSDMPMHKIFPEFSTFIEHNLQKYKMTEFWVKERYLSIDTTYEEKYPIVVYKMTLKELKTQIKNSQQSHL